jgi:hypothetical protein
MFDMDASEIPFVSDLATGKTIDVEAIARL